MEKKMSNVDCENAFKRGPEYEDCFKRGVALLLYFHSDSDLNKLPDFLRDFVSSEISKLNS